MEDREVATARRRFILDMARRRQKPGSGSQAWDRSASFRMNWPSLADIFREIPWAIVGAVATRLYMPERATGDIDVVVLPTDIAEAQRRLQSAGFEPQAWMVSLLGLEFCGCPPGMGVGSCRFQPAAGVGGVSTRRGRFRRPCLRSDGLRVCHAIS